MNTNCLEGKRCPACGHEDEIHVVGKMWLSLTDDGTDPQSDFIKDTSVEYDDSAASCPECKFRGRLGDWDITAQEAEIDLLLCREGQRLRLRDGSETLYGKLKTASADRSLHISLNGVFHWDSYGRRRADRRESPLDVVCVYKDRPE